MATKIEKFYVVKKQLGTDGKWFSRRAACSFGTFEAALSEAKRFASGQRAAGVTGTRIVVRRGRETVVAACNVNRGDLPRGIANADVVYETR